MLAHPYQNMLSHMGIFRTIENMRYLLDIKAKNGNTTWRHIFIVPALDVAIAFHALLRKFPVELQ